MGIVTVDAVTAGVALMLWGFLTFYLWIASLKANKATNLVFLFLFITFFILGIGDASGVVAVTNAGGLMGIVTAATAWYVSAAVVINDGLGSRVPPANRSSRA
jgi:succinate-acetate transporter protein